MRRLLCLFALLPACVGPEPGSESDRRRFSYLVLNETARIEELAGDDETKGMLDDLLRAHERWVGALTDSRLLLASGPLSNRSNDEPLVRGLFLLDLETQELVDGVAARNPAIAEGLFSIESGLFDGPRTLRRAPFLDLVARSLDGGSDALAPEATAVDYFVVVAAQPGPMTTGLEDLEAPPVLRGSLEDGRSALLFDARAQALLEEQVGDSAQVLLWRATKGLRAIAVEPAAPSPERRP